MDKHTVFGSDGSVDVAASAASYSKALTDWKVKNEIPTETIELAVEAVFDRFDGTRLAMPALLHEVVSEMSDASLSYNAVVDRARAYITGQCGVGAARNTGRLDIQKGVGGGVLRLAVPGAEIPARPAKK